ncbi:DUF342 domain-containing protein [Paenibacillus koleovorans]|uniref:DUF342 domain-containing protein n=1 Tax=Paenibacillus koleovorans TaxID=121608 RepID=UPI000FDC8989|nr:FapA family protein [Paenibacillus koleovorans]
MLVYENEFFTLTSDARHVLYIKVRKPGFSVLQFPEVQSAVPRIAITSVLSLRKALEQAISLETEIGTLRDRLELQVTKDGMRAMLAIRLTAQELDLQLADVRTEALDLLQRSGIQGVLPEALDRGSSDGTERLVAQGKLPVQGHDAQVRYFEPSSRRPDVREDGSVDFHQLNFIDEVNPGDWLGEKIEATEGVPGWNVRGEPLPAPKGKDKPLPYDPKSVEEVQEPGKIVLRAKRKGVVQLQGKTVGVDDLLVIQGDVGTETGDIDYDGSVKILGTISDGYSVIATKHLAILGSIGVGAARLIKSKTADVLIHSGVFGQGKAVIEAETNVYMKCASDCTVTAGGDIIIESYAIGSVLNANNVVLDKGKGKIIGGSVSARTMVVAAYIGNELERPTAIQVDGFNRNALKQELDQVLQESQKLLQQLAFVRKEMDIYEMNFDKLKPEDRQKYVGYMAKQEVLVQQVIVFEEKRKLLMDVLRTRGEGEVSIFKKVYPKTSLQLKQIERHIERETAGTFYVNQNKLFLE